MAVNLMEMMKMIPNKEHIIKPPCETNTIHCYGDNNTTTMATKICNMTVILTVRIFVMFSGMPTSGQNDIV